ncbi:aquaporin-like protein [Annulohypoxylon truncatum]|uniref:aquaporin-like protein n=1 Tax=Annulohypoxylon truncatum TaxID=327061 RepID=UPI002007AAAE|nr:aquaporin-like protein [Annulohypoxylon truncatum]KAI1210453.1 aquaporin-like protein [Annulohypoxylon truncatum]
MEQSEIKTHIRRPWQKYRDIDSLKSHDLKLLDVLPLRAKNHAIAAMSEFAGTFMFLLFAFGGTNAVNTNLPASSSSAADPARLLYISLCFGMSLAVNAWVFFRISGGLFNPAVTVGMMAVGALDYVRGPLVMFSQIVGGIAAAAVVMGLTPGPLNVGTGLGGGTTVVQGLFIEMFLTAQLVFTIFMLAAEKHRGTFIAPVGIGLSLFIAELMGVYYTGGSVNPARSFGPSVVTGTFYTYHWIYWVGPILGSLVASGFYVFIKALEYETVNPQQDQPTDLPIEPRVSSEKPERSGRQWDERAAAADRFSVSYMGGSGGSNLPTVEPKVETGRSLTHAH